MCCSERPVLVLGVTVGLVVAAMFFGVPGGLEDGLNVRYDSSLERAGDEEQDDMNDMVGAGCLSGV